jgi:hypothetical protein
MQDRALDKRGKVFRMTSYSFYFVNSDDRIEGKQVYECKGDAQAIAKAHKVLTEFPFTAAVEIWRTRDRVARVTRNPGASKP